MKKFLDVRGCNIVDSTGTIKGIVEDSIIDPDNNKICSLIVANKGIIPSFSILSLKDIDNYSDFIVSDGRLYKLNKLALRKKRGLTMREFIGKEIITNKGDLIGNLADAIFDEKSGSIKAIICTRGFFEDFLHGRKIIIVDEKTVLGREKIVVEKGDMDIINDISFRKFMQ